MLQIVLQLLNISEVLNWIFYDWKCVNTNTDIYIHVNSVNTLYYAVGFVLLKIKFFLELQQVYVHVECR